LIESPGMIVTVAVIAGVIIIEIIIAYDLVTRNAQYGAVEDAKFILAHLGGRNIRPDETIHSEGDIYCMWDMQAGAVEDAKIGNGAVKDVEYPKR